MPKAKQTGIEFKPKQVTKSLLAALNDRSRDVIVSRFGLGKEPKRMTLEAIGGKYDITRERVRQIEDFALTTVRKSDAYQKNIPIFEELRDHIKSLGSVVAEDVLLESMAKDKSTQNNIHFLLVVGDHFTKYKEDDQFKHRWHVDEAIAKHIEESLRKLYSNLDNDDLIQESEMIEDFLEHVKGLSEEYKNEEVIKRWLSISKQIGKNPLGEWGKSESPNIKAKGIRDYAFLVIRRHGSPIHFREVAKAISELFDKKAHVATTHNELIKDPRFVLVGRGLYALSEWGYMSGVVKDVIRKIIEKNGPLTRKEVIEKVLKERYVKENTILVNLQNPKYFKKSADGKYSVAK